MADYDFYNIFEPMEFQDFARDMIQCREGIVFESFARGTDLGIDGRCVLGDGSTVIFQAKRIKNTSQTILSIAKTEKEKLDRLAEGGVVISRYLLALSGDIGVERKRQVMELFFPYIVASEDIITGQDFNNYLSSGDSRYRCVEEKYFKLWIQNTKTLKRTLHEVVNGPLMERSRMNLEEAMEKARYFVETDIYEETLKKLQHSRTLIISGEPGVGKTTLANQTALYYYTKFEFQSFLYASSVEDLYAAEAMEGKKVIVFDDFWGDTGFDGFGTGRKVKDLTSFIEHIQKRKDCILIITTREYILEQGLKKNEEFRKLVETYKLDCRIGQYSREDKLRIYYGHLKSASLTWEQMQSLREADFEIIESSNYNPRVIEKFLQSITPEMPPGECAANFFRYLDCPVDFWKKIFEELSMEAKVVYLLMAIMPLPIESSVLETCYYEVLKTNQKSLEWKGFFEVIIELEKTVIRTDLYNQEVQELRAITFQNPSVKDFIQSAIRNCLEKYHDILFQSCLYFSQCVEYLKLLKEIKGAERKYQKVMAKAVLLLESDSIIFYDKYKQILLYGGEGIRFFQTYRTWETGEDAGFDRLEQLFLLYDREKCPDLSAWFEKTFITFVQTVERYPESVLSEDMESFSDAAIQMAREGICEDVNWLISVYMDCLMWNRMELDGKAWKQSFVKEWTRYITENKDKISTYLEKYYGAELCLTAASGLKSEFDYIKLRCEHEYTKFDWEISESLRAKIQLYEQWALGETIENWEDEMFENDEEDDDDWENYTHQLEHQTWTLDEIEADFDDGYLNEIQPTPVDNLEEWFWMRGISGQVKNAIMAQELDDHVFWNSFLLKEESLEFVLAFLPWAGELPAGYWTAMAAVVRYMTENCKAPGEMLEHFLTQMALSGNEKGIFSKAELERFCPELFLWDETWLEDLEKIHVLVRRQGWYYLSNPLLAFSFHFISLHELRPEEMAAYVSNVFLGDEKDVTTILVDSESLSKLIETGKRWLDKTIWEREFVTMICQLAPDAFLNHVIAPLAEVLYDKLYADSEEEIVYNLIGLLQIEAEFDEDGVCVGGSGDYERYFGLSEIAYSTGFIDVFPDELTEEQVQLLTANAEKKGENWRVYVTEWIDKGLLEYFGIYDKMLTVWNEICHLREKKKGRNDG